MVPEQCHERNAHDPVPGSFYRLSCRKYHDPWSRTGDGFIEILQEQGLVLFLYGALITLFPMIVGYFVATKLMKLSLFNTLGSICGGMTSTPALGTLIRVTGTDDVASAYAATYPVALVFVVLACQFIGIFL